MATRLPGAGTRTVRGAPSDTGFTALQNLSTDTIAKVASLLAIVIGGYVFAEGWEFQEFLRTPEAVQVSGSLRIRAIPQSNGSGEPVEGAADPGKAAEAGNGSRPRN
jgi:hypothetical protein